MAYVTNQNLIDRVGTTKAAELTADSGSTPDQTVLTGVVAAAEGEVNRYLARRRAVPVVVTGDTTLAEMLRELTLDVAQYRLALRRPPVPEQIQKLYEQVIAWLETYAKGEAELAGTGTAGNYGFARDSAGPEDMN